MLQAIAILPLIPLYSPHNTQTIPHFQQIHQATTIPTTRSTPTRHNTRNRPLGVHITYISKFKLANIKDKWGTKYTQST